ncbi:MAG: hypothetical protein Q8L98_06820 [Chlamydiales bacterium]|nr:hypothetical protein [Chlamydiales bacterium]
MSSSIFILRHRRENLKKCTLTGLEQRDGLLFYTYPINPLPNLSNCLLLKVGAPILSEKDAHRDLLLIDGTWRLAAIMEKNLPCKLEERSLPTNWRTAYPRRQTDCPNPEEGLASIEALYIACLLLGKSTEGLLDHYYWKENFFKNNV